jgi:hypothetical protein
MGGSDQQPDFKYSGYRWSDRPAAGVGLPFSSVIVPENQEDLLPSGGYGRPAGRQHAMNPFIQNGLIIAGIIFGILAILVLFKNYLAKPSVKIARFEEGDTEEAPPPKPLP